MMEWGWADPIELRRLEKQKLAIKDCLHRIIPNESQAANAA